MRSIAKFALGALSLAVMSSFAHAGEKLFAEGYASRALGSDPSYQALLENPATAEVRLVSANADALRADTESLSLDLGMGLVLTAHRLNAYTNESGNLVWSGIVEEMSSKLMPRAASYTGRGEIADDPLSSAIFVREGDTVTGNIRVGGELFKVRPLTSGGHAIVAVDERRRPAEHPPEFERMPVIPMAVSADSGTAPDAIAASTIRVMVNYTPGAASQAGNISSLIDLAVAETNQGYANSGVNITMQLANKSQVSYTETGNFTTDLNRYRGTTDGYMDSIHSTRNSVAADVAVLMVKNNAYCGLASGIGSTASTAFAEVYWDCATGYYSFGHEVGHLQSARHDPANDPTNTPYAYGHGYQYAAGGWRTIMAYNCTSGCTRINYWSNPSKTYGGVPMGTSTRSDNERVLNNTAATIAGFR
jgi:peptidyl-Asp metalloendopeptidase